MRNESSCNQWVERLIFGRWQYVASIWQHVALEIDNLPKWKVKKTATLLGKVAANVLK
jgi:hypothetical protein